MWTFVETARIENTFGQWYALVTLSKEGVPESFFLKFESEPTAEQAASAGALLALKKNLDEAPTAATDSIPVKDFIARFTKTEFVKIYRVAEVSDDVFYYLKNMEMNPTVNRQDPRVLQGLQQLEANNLLDYPGRAQEILGW